MMLASRQADGPPNNRRPLILLLDDSEISRRTRGQTLETLGATPICVGEADAAVRELRSSPGIDLIIADVNLGLSSRDKAGLEFARLIKKLGSGVPIAGYSGHFAESEIGEDERDVFDHWIPRGRQTAVELIEELRHCIALATNHRRNLQTENENRLRILLPFEEDDTTRLEQLRRTIPHSADAGDIERVLAEAGFRLRVVEPKQHSQAKDPFLIWTRDGTDGCECEVFGVSSLYTLGENEEDAIDKLLDLMKAFHFQLVNDPGPCSPTVELLKDFLDRVLNVR